MIKQELLRGLKYLSITVFVIVEIYMYFLPLASGPDGKILSFWAVWVAIHIVLAPTIYRIMKDNGFKVET